MNLKIQESVWGCVIPDLQFEEREGTKRYEKGSGKTEIQL